MDILKCNRLGTNVASTERVGFVALDGNNLLTVVLNRETADGFAQVATSKCGFSLSGHWDYPFSVAAPAWLA